MKPIGKLNWKKTEVSIERYKNISIEAPHRITLVVPYTLFSYPPDCRETITDRLLKKIKTLLLKENITVDSIGDEIWAWDDVVVYHIWANSHTIEQWEWFGKKHHIMDQ